MNVNPELHKGDFSFTGFLVEVNNVNSVCLPVVRVWFPSGKKLTVLYKSNGFKFNLMNKCDIETPNCDKTAT